MEARTTNLESNNTIFTGGNAMEKRYTKIGSYTPETDDSAAIIKREFYGQGYIFRDEEAFYTSYDKVCYIPELSDATYTRQNLIDMMDGQEALAECLFDCLDWQHPESLIQEYYANGEYDDCSECGRMFACYGATECPHCHTRYKKDENN